jgi:hypothetical protein
MREVLMSAALLVPLLPLLTTLIVVAGQGAAVRHRVKIAVWPLGAAFCGAVATLYVVATQDLSRSGSMIPPWLVPSPCRLASTWIVSAQS